MGEKATVYKQKVLSMGPAQKDYTLVVGGVGPQWGAHRRKPGVRGRGEGPVVARDYRVVLYSKNPVPLFV